VLRRRRAEERAQRRLRAGLHPQAVYIHLVLVHADCGARVSISGCICAPFMTIQGVAPRMNRACGQQDKNSSWRAGVATHCWRAGRPQRSTWR